MSQEAPKPHAFAETSKMVNGMEFTIAAMREGVMLGGRVGIRYLGQRNDLYVVEFFPMQEGTPGTRYLEAMKLFRRYNYHQNEGIDIFLRGRTARVEGKTMLRFQVESNLTILRARKAEAQF